MSQLFGIMLAAVSLRVLFVGGILLWCRAWSYDNIALIIYQNSLYYCFKSWCCAIVVDLHIKLRFLYGRFGAFACAALTDVISLVGIVGPTCEYGGRQRSHMWLPVLNAVCHTTSGCYIKVLWLRMSASVRQRLVSCDARCIVFT